jgi:AraC-like DNA-binding protein
MGLLMHQEKNDSAAVRYFNEALQIFLSQHDLFNESHSRKGLYEALRHTDPDLAMEHNDRYNALRDSIYDKDTGELLSKYAVEYGYNELQAENEVMRSDRRLSYIIGVIVVLLMLAVLTYGFWHYRRARRRIQELIAEISKLREGVVAPVEVAAEPEGEEPVKEEQPDPDRQFLLHLIDVVNANLPSGRYGVEDIASEMNMGVQTFRRRLLSVTGESPKAFISAIQMELAAKLLTDSPDMSVTQIANRCGYDEVTSFGRTFRKTYGISPSQYRENH